MRTIFYKDLRICAGLKIFTPFAFLASIVILVFANKVNMGLGYTLVVANMYVIVLFSYDESDKSIPYTLTLPINRMDYLNERYLIGIVMNTLNFIILTILIAISNNLGRSSSFMLNNEGILSIIIVYSCSIIIIGICLPFLFIFGSMRTMVIIFSTVAVIGLGIFGFTQTGLGKSFGKSIEEFVMNNPKLFTIEMAAIYSLTIAFLIMIVSYFIARNYIKKKDF